MLQHTIHSNPKNNTESDAGLRLKRLSESGIVAVACFTTDGRITEANNAFLDTLGVTAEDLLSGNVRWNDYTLKEWLPRTHQAIEELKTTGIITPYEKQFRRSDGMVRWGIFGGAMLPDGETGISFVIDITERKHDEQNQAFLSEISKQLMELDDLAVAMERLGEKIAKHFGVPWCNFTELADDLETGVLSYGWNAPHVPSLKGTYRVMDIWAPEQAARYNAGEITIANDIQNDPRLKTETYSAFGIRSLISVPLARNGKFRFLHCIMDAKPRQWRNDEIALMQELVSRIWARLEKARAEEALREREAWLEGQKQAFQAAMSGQPLAVSLQSLIDTIVAQTNGEAMAAFYTVTADRKNLHLVAGMSEAYLPDANGFKAGPESVASGLPIYTDESVITPDVEREPCWTPFLAIAHQHNYRGCWSFPVQTSGGPVLGTFALYFERPRQPSPPELELAGILAHAAAIIMSWYKESAERVKADTALQKNEKQLQNDAARLRATLQSISDAVYIGDYSGITLANQPALDQLGYTSYQDLNRNIGTLSVEIQTRDAETNEIIPPVRQAFARALAGEYVTQNVRIKQQKSGSERIVRSAASPVVVDGKIVAAVAVNTDITEQWQTAAALQESERKLREFNESLEQQIKERTAELQENHKLLESIYNTTHVGMSVFKPVYNSRNKIKDFKIVIVNKRIEDSSGRKDLSGKLYSKEFPDIKKMGLFDAMVKAMETGEPVQLEYFSERDGINRWYSTMCTPNGDMLVCSNTDMTEQKQAEERNRDFDRRQKELEDSRQQEIFKTILDTQEVERKRIAEALHNSLGQILYAAKLSLGTIDKSSIAESDQENLKSADKLLNDAITESRRLSHELMPVILEDFGLKTAIEDICRKLSGKTQFKCRFKGSIKQIDKYVEVAIYRLVQELVMNVINHSGASNSLVAVEVYADRIVVLVQDDGRGFNALKEKKGGIGLKTIRNNVNLLNGRINITSKAGNGTSINIEIPFKSDK